MFRALPAWDQPVRFAGENTYSDAGSIRVFEYGTAANPTGWSQVGGEIDGVAQSDRFGSAVAISADGNRIVFGAPNRDIQQKLTYYYGVRRRRRGSSAS